MMLVLANMVYVVFFRVHTQKIRTFPTGAYTIFHLIMEKKIEEIMIKDVVRAIVQRKKYIKTNTG